LQIQNIPLLLIYILVVS